MEKLFKRILLLFFVLGLFTNVFFHFTYAQDVNTVRIVEVVKANEESNYQKMFSDFRISIEIIHEGQLDALDLSKVDVLIITQAVAERYIDEARILEAVGSGMQLLLEKHQSVGKQLGIEFGKGTKITDGLVDNAHPEVDVFWDSKETIPTIVNSNLSVHCISKDKSTPIVVSGNYKRGSFVYTSIGAYANKDELQYYRIPFMMQILSKTFDFDFHVKRDQLIVYMDWGYYYDQDPEKLAKQFKNSGISEIHLSAWYDIPRTKTFYDEFITACNEQGILVYAWFELPMVTEQFWKAHPEWREQTGMNEDAHISWRYLMAMENPECMEAIKTYIGTYLGFFNWDGVDIAELYFESPDGFESPKTFTPLSNYVRKEFKAKSGVDPIELFDSSSPYHYSKTNNEIKTQFLQYRRDLITNLNEEIISYVKSLKKGNLPYSIYVTQIESTKDSKMYDNIGVDSDAFIKLQNEYDFLYIVEDPFTLWALGPARYSEMSKYYKGKMNRDQDVLFDVNIVERSRIAYENLYPTVKQTGLELYDLVSHAMVLSDRVCLYAAHTVSDYDYDWLPFVLSNKSQVEKTDDSHIKTTSDNTFKYLEDMTNKQVLIDGKISPFVNDDFILVPKGEHFIEFKEIDEASYQNRLRILDFNGEIQSFKNDTKSVEIEYNEKRNVLVTTNKMPTKIFLEGVEKSLEILYNGDSFVVKGPLGNHKMTLIYEPYDSSRHNLFILGRQVIFKTSPLMINNKSLYSAEELFEILGASFTYHEGFKTYTGEKEGYVFWIQMDNPYAKSNGEEVHLEMNGIKKEGINYVPLKFICEALNFKVDYIPEHNIITVNKLPRIIK